MEILLIALFIFGLNFFLSKLFQKVFPKLKKTKKSWDDALAGALYRPLHIFSWLLGLSWIANISKDYAKSLFLWDAIPVLRKFTIMFLFVWFLLAFTKNLERNLLLQPKGKKNLDRTTIQASLQILRVAGIVSAGLMLLQACGIPVSGVIAFGGVGGIAVGFAAKDLLANFFGALMIFLDRPFSIGDWIRSPDRDIEGFVEHIGWRLTRIRTLERRPLYVPNSVFSTIAVENPGRMSNRRIKTNIGIRYADASKMEEILAEIEAMLKSHEGIDQTRLAIARFVAFSASSLEIMIYAFTRAVDLPTFQKVQQDVFLKVLSIIQRHGAQCAFPTTTVHIPEEGPFKHFINRSDLSSSAAKYPSK